MDRRPLLVTITLTVAIAAMLGSVSVSATAAEPPSDNVVIIHVDDLGWRDLGCMGSPVYETPYIDALAASGMRYTNAYAAGSLCTPSRACMLTGSQPSRHGVYTVVKNRGEKKQWKVIPEKNNQFLPEGYPTIGTVLTGAGIANGTVGKWHIGAVVPAHGFQEGIWGGYLGMPINYFAPFKLPFLPKDVPDGAYLPSFVREAGVAFLQRHRNEQFFLYFSTYLPHNEIRNEDGSTLTAPEAVVRKYERKIAAMKKAGKDLQGHDNPVYAAMIEETDRSVGAIIDKLKELGLRKKTLVLFISDNGGLDKYTSQLPLRGDKGTLYEGGVRVPMIASMPGRVQAGRISDEPVSGIDFYPTICSFMGLKPTDPDKVDGEDLTDLIFAGKPLGERNLFWNFPVYNHPRDLARCPRSAMRRGDWKIHHRYEDDGYELYNLIEDIGESRDLAKTRPEILAMMRRELGACYERFGAVKKLVANPEYDADSR
ncbi:MAG TPA: sulfatase [Planctomycetes bacterium]|nr:sulfatase [Planctomycetota bacterium]HIL36394.1 sulfatase [Planctomycetota bacterium]